jgi:hypothetical protein
VGLFSKLAKRSATRASETPTVLEATKLINYSSEDAQLLADQTVRVYGLDLDRAFSMAEAVAKTTLSSSTANSAARQISMLKLSGTNTKLYQAGQDSFVTGAYVHALNSPTSALNHTRIARSFTRKNPVEISYRRNGFLQIRRGFVVKLYTNSFLLRSPQGYRHYNMANIHGVAQGYEDSTKFFQDITVHTQRESQSEIRLRASQLNDRALKSFVDEVKTYRKTTD